MLVLFLSIAFWWGLGNAIRRAWSVLVLALVWGVVPAVLYSSGRKTMGGVHPKPERTMSALKEVSDALKGRQDAQRCPAAPTRSVVRSSRPGESLPMSTSCTRR